MLQLSLTDDDVRLLIEALAGHEEDTKENAAFAWHLGSMQAHATWVEETRHARRLRETIERERVKV